MEKEQTREINQCNACGNCTKCLEVNVEEVRVNLDQKTSVDLYAKEVQYYYFFLSQNLAG